jgi:SAM-dependent methyltransferase
MLKHTVKRLFFKYNFFKYYTFIISLIKKQKNKYKDIPIIDLDSFAFENEDIVINKIKNHKEFISYANSMKPIYEKRDQVENFLVSQQTSLLIRTFDPIFDKTALLHLDFENSPEDQYGVKRPNIRESLLNTEYLLNSRNRGVMAIMNHKIPIRAYRKKDVYLTEKVTPLFGFFELFFDNLVGSEYLGESYLSGQFVNGIRHEDLTKLSFNTNSFDLLVSLEVLEHIPAFEKALFEIYRVLRPGGVAFITTPFDTSKYEITKRALIKEDGSIEHLLPPDYHGDPMKKEGILCFQYFGWELLDMLRGIGFSSAEAYFTWSLKFGILGHDLMVIYIKK